MIKYLGQYIDVKLVHCQFMSCGKVGTSYVKHAYSMLHWLHTSCNVYLSYFALTRGGRLLLWGHSQSCSGHLIQDDGTDWGCFWCCLNGNSSVCVRVCLCVLFKRRLCHTSQQTLKIVLKKNRISRWSKSTNKPNLNVQIVNDGVLPSFPKDAARACC